MSSALRRQGSVIVDFVIVLHGNASAGDVLAVLRDGLRNNDVYTVDMNSLLVSQGPTCSRFTPLRL